MTPRVMALIASGVLNLVLLGVIAWYQDRLEAVQARRVDRQEGRSHVSARF